MAGSAVHPQQNAVLCFRGGPALGISHAWIQPLGHQQAEQPAHTNLYKSAPIQRRGPKVYRTGAAAKLTLRPLLLQIQQLVIFFATWIIVWGHCIISSD